MRQFLSKLTHIPTQRTGNSTLKYLPNENRNVCLQKPIQTTVTVALLVSQTGNNTNAIERKMVKQLLVYLHYRIRLSDNKEMSDSYMHQFQKHFVE